MKKTFKALISLIILFSCIFSVTANASFIETENINGIIIKEETYYLQNGYYVTETVIVEDTITTMATTYTKNGSKSYVLKDKNNEELWRFNVHGTFTVNSGVSATCTSSYYTVKITDDSWEKKTASTSKASNKAIGEATFIKKVLFVTTETVPCKVTLTCDKNGNLS